MAWLQASHGDPAQWENQTGSLLLLAHYTYQACCLQPTHPVLGDCARYLWGYFSVLSMLRSQSQQGCLSLGSSSLGPTPLVAEGSAQVPGAGVHNCTAFGVSVIFDILMPVFAQLC